MPLRALVLSADAKISGLLAQILAELEVSAEVCADADMARQKLAGLVYSALVLDCDKESEVGNLLKEARKLAAGRKLAFVALVGGPGAPATAFRLGADFVLTKPIGVQQARNTLRTLKLVLEKMPVQAPPEVTQRATAAAAAAAAGGDAAPFRDLSISTPPVAPEKSVASVTPPAETSAEKAEEPPEALTEETYEIAEVAPAVSPAKAGLVKTVAEKAAATKAAPTKPLVVRPATTPAPQPSFKLMDTYTDQRKGSSLVGKLLILAVLLVGLVIVFRNNIPWQSLGPLAQVAQTVGLYTPVADAPAPAPEEPGSTTPKPEPGTPESQSADASGDATQNAAAPAADAAPPDALDVAEEEMEKLLAQRIEPVIPADQLPSGPVSPVVLHAWISKDGFVTDAKLLQGEPQLAPYAMRAVRQWKYRPYVQNDQPVNVQTQITVTFGQQ
jgi:outer membrane biosynthesis protein TonB